MVKKTSDGQVVDRDVLEAPQTSEVAGLHREFQGHPSRGLTPSRTAQIIEAAEQGDIIAQFELFEDMEERDAHIASEMSKRRRAVSGLDWSIVPPPNASAQEKVAAEKLQEVVDQIDEFEEVLFDVTDAIGKGFSAQEIEWQRVDGIFMPKSITHRPQSWMRLHRGFREELRLRDGSPDGAELYPFGWLVHTHKSKSGYLERSSLFRALIWPYLFKNYSVADLAEWLEIYGIPMRIGKFPSGSSDKEKLTLLKALVSVGHNAAGIIPDGMDISFHDAATGDAKAFELMIDWCERSESKVILGATLTSQADRGSNTNALGNIHNEVRKDLRDSDAKQVGKAITRELLYPIALLNGWVDSIRRVPRFVPDISEREDLEAFSNALPKLVNLGFKVGRQWAQEQVGIPEPEGDEEVLSATPIAVSAPEVEPPADVKKPDLKLVKARAELPSENPAERDYIDALTDNLIEQLAVQRGEWLDRIQALVATATDYDDLLLQLADQFGELSLDEMGMTLETALTAAGMAGRYDTVTGYADNA